MLPDVLSSQRQTSSGLIFAPISLLTRRLPFLLEGSPAAGDLDTRSAQLVLGNAAERAAGLSHPRLCPIGTTGRDLFGGQFVAHQPKREHGAGTERGDIRQRVVVRGAGSGRAEEQLTPVGQRDIAAIGAQGTALCLVTVHHHPRAGHYCVLSES